MKIAIPASNGTPTSPVEARFARAPFFLVFDDTNDSWETVENAQVLHAVQGAGIQAAETLVRQQVNAVLTTHCGPKAFRALHAAGITVYTEVTGRLTPRCNYCSPVRFNRRLAPMSRAIGKTSPR